LKLLYDLFKRIFARIIILLLVAVTLVAMEAHEKNQASIEAEEISISKAIQKIDKTLDTQRRSLGKKTKHQKKLKQDISTKTRAINSSNQALEKSRKAKLKDKLPPWKAVEHLHNVLRHNIHRVALSIEYSQLMFSIVDINKVIAQEAVKRARLNNKLILIQTGNFFDYILQQDDPTKLLTPGDKLLLLALFYAFFFGPVTLKALNYFVLAPLARKAPAIVINSKGDDNHKGISYGISRREFKVQLAKGDNLIIRPGWYSMNTDGTARTRFFWHMAAPFASYAMGLINMIEFKHNNHETREIRLGCEEDPNQSMLPVHLDQHPGYVIRQGHVVATAGEGLAMEKKWQVWDWKSWLFGNIRYVYFTGTGTVYISGHGNVAVNDSAVNTRIKEQHVVGFDTRNPVKVLRSETFGNYWLNHKPLYDIHFPEQGCFLQQQSYGERDDKVFRSLFEDIMGAIGKLLGF
jgi:uncharacterized protein (AIM24 family)